jgi:hypothetical protein
MRLLFVLVHGFFIIEVRKRLFVFSVKEKVIDFRFIFIVIVF